MRICLPDSVTANNAHLVFIGVVHERGQLQQMIYIKTVQNRYQLHEVRFCAFNFTIPVWMDLFFQREEESYIILIPECKYANKNGH